MAVTKFSSGSSFKNLTKYDDFLAGNPAYIPSNFESIASATGTGSSGTITFSSIPSTYIALQIRGIARSTTAGAGQTNIIMRMNGDSSSVYSFHRLDNVTAASSATQTSMNVIGNTIPTAGHPAGDAGIFVIDIHNYASTTQNKTVRSISGLSIDSTVGTMVMGSGLYQSTTAVSSLDLILNSGFFNTVSKLSLYGIKGA